MKKKVLATLLAAIMLMTMVAGSEVKMVHLLTPQQLQGTQLLPKTKQKALRQLQDLKSAVLYRP